MRARQPADVGVERAGEAAIGGDRHQQMHLVACRCRPAASARSGCRPALAASDASIRSMRSRIGPRRLRLRLRAAQLGGGDHLHGAGDLLRRFDAVDAVAEGFQAGHAARHRPAEDALAVTSAAQANALVNPSRKAISFFSVSGLISRSLRIASRMPGSRAWISLSSCGSNAPTWPTGDAVEIAAHAGEHRDHLLLDRQRLVLRLLQQLGQPRAARQQFLRRRRRGRRRTARTPPFRGTAPAPA